MCASGSPWHPARFWAPRPAERSAGRSPGASDGAPIDPSAPDGPGAPAYREHRLPLAMGGSLGVGMLSSLLGVGGGIVQVPLMRLVMGAPMAIAAATSNYLIGVTAAAGRSEERRV